MTLHRVPGEVRAPTDCFNHALLTSDVGGGSVLDDEPHSLGHVTFRWMLHEIHRSECSILFDNHALRDLGIPTDCIPPSPTKDGPAVPDLQSTIPTLVPAPASHDPACTSRPPIQRTGFSSFLRALRFRVQTATTQGYVLVKETLPDQALKPCADLDAIDALAPMHDQLVANPLWRLLQTPTWYPGEFWCVPSPRTI